MRETFGSLTIKRRILAFFFLHRRKLVVRFDISGRIPLFLVHSVEISVTGRQTYTGAFYSGDTTPR